MTENITQELGKEINANYKELAKWLIALSTGAIVFSVKMVNNETLPIWRDLLALALGLLLISIVVGVRYVRLLIDFKGHNCNRIIDRHNLKSLANLLPGSEQLFDGKLHKV